MSKLCFRNIHKVVILAGGFGTRISEESQYKPKPMIEIGGIPIILHIMRYYARYGFKDFIVCAGYKQEKIKEYFNNFFLYNSKQITFSKDEVRSVQSDEYDDWNVTVVDTGVGTLTGGRLKQVKDLIPDSEKFLMTYGDGLSDVDIGKLILFDERNQDALVTITGILPESRYGVLDIGKDGKVSSFREKSAADSKDWINGGFMVIDKKALDYIDGDEMFENSPLQKIASDGKLYCYKHYGKWQCMDTLRDKEKLEQEWANRPFWRNNG